MYLIFYNQKISFYYVLKCSARKPQIVKCSEEFLYNMQEGFRTWVLFSDKYIFIIYIVVSPINCFRYLNVHS